MSNEANIWNPSSLLQVSANTKRAVQRFTAVAGQVLFTLTDFTYATGTGALAVYKKAAADTTNSGAGLLTSLEFAEGATNTFMLVTPAAAGDIIVAVGYVGVTANVDVRDTDIFIANYQALRDYTGTEITVYVQGTTTHADGGQSIFNYVSGAAIGTYTDDNSSVIVPTGGDGSAAWISHNRLVRAVNSISDLQGLASAYEGQRIDVTGYHSATTVGGGPFSWKLSARHDGGMKIDPNRTFPTDWNDSAQLDAWFLDSGVDVPCWERVSAQTQGPIVVSIEDFGGVAKVSGDTTRAIANSKAINAILSALASTGGKINFGAGYYYFSGQVSVTGSGYWFDGIGDPYTAVALGTHLATTATTGDVIQVNDSVQAVAGFRLSNMAVIGNKNVVGATSGSGLNVICSQGAGRAHSLIYVHDASFVDGFDYGMVWQATGGSNFIFNCKISNINTRTCGKDGVLLTGRISQVYTDKVYTENNDGHQFNLDGGGTGGLKSITLDRVTCSLSKVGKAGMHLQEVDSIDVNNIYMEDTAGANFIIRSARNLNIIGGSMDQLLATSTGILMGTNDANDTNRNITIDIPGWAKGVAATTNYIDLTAYPGGVVCDGLYLGRNADGVLDSNDVDGYDTVFFADRIRFLYENFRDLPTIAVQAGAGTGATATFTAGTVSTDKKGRFDLTHGTAAWTATAQVRITFNAPFDNPPVVNIQAESTTSAIQSQTNEVSCVTTTTYFELTFATALSAQPAFPGQWSYIVVGD